MRLKDAMEMINDAEKGFRVHFEVREDGVLKSDYFPDKDEDLFETEIEAWELARRFANACEKKKSNVVNVYVIDHNFKPVSSSLISVSQ